MPKNEITMSPKAPEKEPAQPSRLVERLLRSRRIMLSSSIDARTAERIVTQLLILEAESESEPIQLFINSPGGEIYSGFSIFDMIRFIKPPVLTIVNGLAASMGSIIALAAPPERRLALPNSKFLIHQPLISGMVQGSATEIEIHAQEMLAAKARIVEVYQEATGKSEAEIREDIDRDHWLSAPEAKAYGLISRIVSSGSEV
jgi:ATP-dependent Clp protease protease subunit